MLPPQCIHWGLNMLITDIHWGGNLPNISVIDMLPPQMYTLGRYLPQCNHRLIHWGGNIFNHRDTLGR